jgi:hypothetical protein
LAANGDTIVFSSNLRGQTITLTSGSLPIHNMSLTIVGLGATDLTISGGGTNQVFDVANGFADFGPPLISVSLSGLSIVNGHTSFSGAGGGITNSGRVDHSGNIHIVNLTVTGCTLSGNSAPDGGGILNNQFGILTISNCAVSGNTGTIAGGGILNQGGTLTVSNCTLAGNSAGMLGGGIDNGGSLTVMNSTLAGNRAQSGGGIWNSGFMSAQDTIVAGNGAGTGPDIYGAVSLDVGHNLIGNATGGSGFVSSDLLNVNPLLGPLQDNGGPTRTMALLPGSPAIDAGDDTGASTTDQRGFARIVNGTVDIGAFEVQIFQVYNTADSGGGSLRTALTNADQAGGSIILFLVGGLINLASQLPLITRSVQVIGPEAIPLTVQRSTAPGTPAFNVFAVAAPTSSIPDLDVILSNLTIASGDAGNGGGIVNLATLTIRNCTLSGNSAGLGGAIQNRRTLTVIDSTLSGNTANSGGGILNIFGTLSITNSTVANNSALVGGGGIDNRTFAGTMTIHDTILADNRAPTGPDLLGMLTLDMDFNLIGNSSDGSGFNGGHDLLDKDPVLGPLQPNGGPTPTMALLPGSPAVDAGDNTNAPDFDQRGPGFPRIVGGTVDIGAFEAQIGAATQLAISAPSRVTAGSPFDITVTALDAYGHVARGYTGTILFSTTDPDPGVVLPADYTFTLADGGVHTFTNTGLGEITLITRGYQTLTVTDTADGSVMGSAAVKVRHVRHHDGGSPGLPAGQDLAAADGAFAALQGGDFVLWLASPRHRYGDTGPWD